MHSNPLTRKLSSFAEITADDAAALDWLCADVRPFKAKRDLIKEGDRPEQVFLMIDGWAMRYKLLRNGRRQIMAVLVPGDLCDAHVFILREMDHNIGLLCDAQVALIPKEKILTLTDERPRLARALWWSALVDESVLREWLVNMGQRDAHGRIAHLIAEFWLRLETVGLIDGDSFKLPLTQEEIGDAMGLTPVHVNRTLQRMRSSGLIELSRGTLQVPDFRRLCAASGFNPNYLHLDRRSA